MLKSKIMRLLTIIMIAFITLSACHKQETGTYTSPVDTTTRCYYCETVYIWHGQRNQAGDTVCGYTDAQIREYERRKYRRDSVVQFTNCY